MNKERLKKLEGIAIEILPTIIFEIIGKEAELEFQLITITGVNITPDLSYIDILVSAIKNAKNLPKFLAEHNYEIQKKFNKSINIRKLPKIRFRLDDSGKNSQKIHGIVSEITKELKKAGEL